MPTIVIRLNDKEFEAICQYAEQCGETIPDLVRKSLIREATLADGFGADDPSYDYNMTVVVRKSSARQERRFVEQNYNRIRRILGWREIKF